MSEWISVEDRLPEAGQIKTSDGDRVLIFYKTWKEVFIACRVFTEDCWCWMDQEDDCYSPQEVTHWMELPEPPK